MSDYGPDEKRYRFRPKRFGWGFVPVSWEGWLFTLFLVLVILGAGRRNGFFDTSGLGPTQTQAVSYIVDLFLVIFSSLWFMDKQTDGDLKRRWGNEDG